MGRWLSGSGRESWRESGAVWRRREEGNGRWKAGETWKGGRGVGRGPEGEQGQGGGRGGRQNLWVPQTPRSVSIGSSTILRSKHEHMCTVHLFRNTKPTEGQINVRRVSKYFMTLFRKVQWYAECLLNPSVPCCLFLAFPLWVVRSSSFNVSFMSNVPCSITGLRLFSPLCLVDGAPHSPMVAQNQTKTSQTGAHTPASGPKVASSC